MFSFTPLQKLILPFTCRYVNGSADIAKSAYKELHASLATADTILIAGGGAVGVETAGELGYHLKKKITLLSGGSRLLPHHNPGNSTSAQSQLKSLGVETIHDLRVTSSRKIDGAKTEVTLSDGTTRTVDVYIDATGPTRNSSFLPESWLNSSRQVLVDEKTFRATAPGASSVYAAGDIASSSDGGVMTVMMGTGALGSSIAVDIAKEVGVKSPVAQKNYKPLRNSQLVTIGPGGGVAQIMGWRMPSLMVWMLKSRTMFLEKAEGSVKGADQMKP